MPRPSAICWRKDDHAADPLPGMLPAAAGRPMRFLSPSSEKPPPVPAHRRRLVCKKGRAGPKIRRKQESLPVDRSGYDASLKRTMGGTTLPPLRSGRPPCAKGHPEAQKMERQTETAPIDTSVRFCYFCIRSPFRVTFCSGIHNLHISQFNRRSAPSCGNGRFFYSKNKGSKEECT